MSFTGRIKSFNAEKGFGFIEGEETRRRYGKDIFVLRSAFPDGAQTGDEVSFDVTEEQARGPVARQVRLLAAAPTSGGNPYVNPYVQQPSPSQQGSIGRVPMRPPRGGPPPPAPPPPPPPRMPSGMPGRGDCAFVGTVKLVDQQKGWGMVSCEETHRQYGKDVFFARNVVPEGEDLRVGDEVGFTVKMESKGPAVQELHLPWLAPPPFAGSPYGRQPAPSSYGYGPPPVYPPPPMHPSGPPPSMPPQAPQQTFYGVIKSLQKEKGWGHIVCEATKDIFNQDVFFIRGEFGGQPCEKGDLVSFKVEMGQKGPRAIGCSVLPAGAFALPGEDEPGSSFTGTVVRWNQKKGFGFLEGDDLRHIFSKDVFLAKRELDDLEVGNGDTLQFSVELDKTGKPKATGVALADGSATGAGEMAQFPADDDGRKNKPKPTRRPNGAARSAPF